MDKTRDLMGQILCGILIAALAGFFRDKAISMYGLTATVVGAVACSLVFALVSGWGWTVRQRPVTGAAMGGGLVGVYGASITDALWIGAASALIVGVCIRVLRFARSATTKASA